MLPEQFPGFEKVSDKRKGRMRELYGAFKSLGTITATEIQGTTRARLFRALHLFDVSTDALEAALHKETPSGSKTKLPEGATAVILRGIRQFNIDAIAERLDHELFLSLEEGVSMRRRQR